MKRKIQQKKGAELRSVENVMPFTTIYKNLKNAELAEYHIPKLQINV